MENLCYFLETNFSDLCELFLYISIAGFIIYLPFRSHWGKIFSFSNSMVFYACLAIPVICMMSAYQSVKPVTMGERIVLILITAVCAIVGLINLLICFFLCLCSFTLSPNLMVILYKMPTVLFKTFLLLDLLGR